MIIGILTNEVRSQRPYKGESLLNNINNYTIIDIETTGLDPKVDEIIEISAIKIRDNKIVSEYSTLIKPQHEISDFITNLTGITNEMVDDKPAINIVLNDYFDFLDNDIIVGHNINFDINFLYDASIKYYNKPFENDYIDTLRLSRKYLSLENNKLGTIANFFNIDYSGAHRSLNDCYITFNIYNELKKKSLDVMEKENQQYKKILANYQVPKNNIFKNSIVCVKGTLHSYNFEFLVKIGEKCNIKEISYIFTNKTNFLILGNNKYKKFVEKGESELAIKANRRIKENGLIVMSEDEFYKSLNLPLINHNVIKEHVIRNFELNKNDITFNPLYKKECVVTGTLEKITREECHSIITKLGGIPGNNVTKKSNYLILGNNDYNPILRGKKSNKQIKAEQAILNGQDIQIISENVFYDMINDFIKL